MSSIPLPKPAAARTLKTKYAELAATTSGRIDVSTEKGKEISELLHRFFAACSNLYGTIQLRGHGTFSASWSRHTRMQSAGRIFLRSAIYCAQRICPTIYLNWMSCMRLNRLQSRWTDLL